MTNGKKMNKKMGEVKSIYILLQGIRETLIKSLSDFILGFLYRARNHLTRIASYLRKMMTKLCIKIHMKSGSAI